MFYSQELFLAVVAGVITHTCLITLLDVTRPYLSRHISDCVALCAVRPVCVLCLNDLGHLLRQLENKDEDGAKPGDVEKERKRWKDLAHTLVLYHHGNSFR